eukprot:CAMPEP_0172183812 /NCGR_PEP_ID=MMETSP1050-20130122/19207_1 /TAXON_ID=233186 /ORGANISM="Cryptomonas curvata, Strain CCAP979/52" /LENGTH=75 /DNA_ID=CAMNT_0012857499 /DNA_START=12 /DNA_END=239 /DNA_ORIENTATION=+
MASCGKDRGLEQRLPVAASSAVSVSILTCSSCAAAWRQESSISSVSIRICSSCALGESTDDRGRSSSCTGEIMMP